MKFQTNMDDSLLVDISDALSERDRVRFTVHTRTKLPQFAKQVLSVVRQHEEFIWLHDSLVENDQYAGYIIPPPPPKPDFDASREKLQRLGECEANLTKEEFAKMKQELEAEYLAIFKKTVAMHEMFLQRLASHDKLRLDHNFKIFLEYENELAVRGKSKRERLAGSIQNIGKSLTDFVITTSQVANSNSISSIASVGGLHNNNNNINNESHNSNSLQHQSQPADSTSQSNHSECNTNSSAADNGQPSAANRVFNHNSIDCNDGSDIIDEQYFEKERLFLALYYNSIRETAICADRVTQAHKCVAESYLNVAQQLVKLASIEVLPITAKTKDSSSFVACPLPSLTLPATFSSLDSFPAGPSTSSSVSTAEPTSSGGEKRLELLNDSRELPTDEDDGMTNVPLTPTTSDSCGPSTSSNNKKSVHSDPTTATGSNFQFDNKQGDKSIIIKDKSDGKSKGGCANNHTSEDLKKLLLHISDYLEQAKKIEARVASDEDLKLTDTLLYYKRDTVAAQDLLTRRLRFMAEYENATKNLEKARVKGRTAMQYADVIQKQAKENFVSISKLAKQELCDYKQRRVASFKKSFSDLAELEIKHLRSHSQLIVNCLNICNGLTVEQPQVAGRSATLGSASNRSGSSQRK